MKIEAFGVELIILKHLFYLRKKSVSKFLYEASRRHRRCYTSTKKATRKLLMKKHQRKFAAQQMQFVFHCKEGSQHKTGK